MFHVNKKIITGVIIAALACAYLTGCEDKAKVNSTTDPATSNQPYVAHFTFVEHGQDTPSTLESTDKQLLYVSASAEKAAFVAENRIDRPTAKKINDVLTQAYERSKNLYNNMVDDFDAYISSESDPDMLVFPWESSADFNCLRNDSKAISVSETIESKSAGKVFSTTVYTYNFDPANGDHINQVFYVTDDKASFDAADNTMYTKLVDKYGKDVISYDNVASSFVEVASQCWYFTENGVHVAFNVGTIAAEDAGILELDYSKEELPEFAQKYFD